MYLRLDRFLHRGRRDKAIVVLVRLNLDRYAWNRHVLLNSLFLGKGNLGHVGSDLDRPRSMVDVPAKHDPLRWPRHRVVDPPSGPDGQVFRILFKGCPHPRAFGNTVKAVSFGQTRWINMRPCQWDQVAWLGDPVCKKTKVSRVDLDAVPAGSFLKKRLERGRDDLKLAHDDRPGGLDPQGMEDLDNMI